MQARHHEISFLSFWFYSSFISPPSILILFLCLFIFFLFFSFPSLSSLKLDRSLLHCDALLESMNSMHGGNDDPRCSGLNIENEYILLHDIISIQKKILFCSRWWCNNSNVTADCYRGKDERRNINIPIHPGCPNPSRLSVFLLFLNDVNGNGKLLSVIGL